jgi:hypothetical protein
MPVSAVTAVPWSSEQYPRSVPDFLFALAWHLSVGGRHSCMSAARLLPPVPPTAADSIMGVTMFRDVAPEGFGLFDRALGSMFRLTAGMTFPLFCFVLSQTHLCGSFLLIETFEVIYPTPAPIWLWQLLWTGETWLDELVFLNTEDGKLNYQACHRIVTIGLPRR